MSPGFVSFSGSSTNVFVLQPYVQEDGVTRDARRAMPILDRRETLDTHPRSVRGTYAVPHDRGLYLELIFCLCFSSPRITSYSPPSSRLSIASFSVCLAASRRSFSLNLQYRYVRSNYFLSHIYFLIGPRLSSFSSSGGL